MFVTLQIEGFGPHATKTLDIPAGWVEFAGPSGCGKTSATIGALLFGLLGLDATGAPVPTEAVNASAGLASVSLVAASGTRITRTLRNDAGRTTTRTVERHGGLTTCRTEDALRAQLGPVAGVRTPAGTWTPDATRAELTRVILTPFAWRALLQRDLGRPLRDLLLAVLPTTDLRAALAERMVAAGHELRADDPTDEKGAQASLKAANATAKIAAGALSEAEAALSRLAAPVGTEAPSESAVAQARATVEAGVAWRSYDEQLARVEAARASLEVAIRSRDEWRARLAALGERPVVDDSGLVAARKERDAALVAVGASNGIVNDARAKIAILKGRRAVVVEQVGAARAAYKRQKDLGDACPECGRAGHPKHAERLAELEADGKAKAAVLAHLDEEIAGAEVELAQYQVDAAAAADRVRTASARVTELEAALAPLRAWDDARDRLGREPTVAGEPQAPAEPSQPRPDPYALTAADIAIRAAQEAAGAQRQRAADRNAAEANVAAKRRTSDLAAAEAGRVAILLDLVRRVPSELAAAQAEAMGDTGPVRFRFPPAQTKTTPVVEVLFEDDAGVLLDHAQASTGWEVLIDAWVRAILRRLAGLEALPLVIDRTQDWSGAWPAFVGPVWLLTTTDAVALTVRAVGSEAA